MDFGYFFPWIWFQQCLQGARAQFVGLWRDFHVWIVGDSIGRRGASRSAGSVQ